MNFHLATYDTSTAPNLSWLLIPAIVLVALGIYLSVRADRARKAQDNRRYGNFIFAAMIITLIGSFTFIGWITGPAFFKLNGYVEAGDQSVHNLQVAARDSYGVKLSADQATALLGDVQTQEKLARNRVYGSIAYPSGGKLSTLSLIRENGRWALATSALTELPKAGA